MTTNGSMLAGKAAELKRNGLQRVNISVDSLDVARYRRITRGGDLREVLAGIDAAVEAGRRRRGRAYANKDKYGCAR